MIISSQEQSLHPPPPECCQYRNPVKTSNRASAALSASPCAQASRLFHPVSLLTASTTLPPMHTTCITSRVGGFTQGSWLPTKVPSSTKFQFESCIEAQPCSTRMTSAVLPPACSLQSCYRIPHSAHLPTTSRITEFTPG